MHALRFGVLITGLALLISLPTNQAYSQLVLDVNSRFDQPDANPGDGICLTAAGKCTLRAALEETNAYPNTTDFDIITFYNIPLVSGKARINVTGFGLPQITEAVKIRGGTAPPGLTRIDGSNASYANGLYLRYGSAGSVIKGMIIGNFPLAGILIIDDDIKIQHSYIGTKPNGGNLGNGTYGIHCSFGTGGSSRDILIGGADSGNVIGFNQLGGINFSHAYSSRIAGNVIGVCDDGSNCGNAGAGIRISDNLNTVGGDSLKYGNIIGFNEVGILMEDGGHSIIQNNFIGVSKEGEDIGNENDGIEIAGILWSNEIGYGPYDDISGAGSLHNTIAFNGGNAVRINGLYAQASIRGNVIYENGEQGIDLDDDGFTANDSGDADDGPNGLQNFPDIDRVGFNDTREIVFIEYEVDADTAYVRYPIVVDFYIADGVVNAEGKTYIGSDTYSTPGMLGQAEFDLSEIPFTDDDVFVATATDFFGNTSEFSPATVSVGDAFFTSIFWDSPSTPKFHPSSTNEIPGTHLLSSAYPNPFNPLTTFSLAIKEPGIVRISVHDAIGRQVAQLHNGPLTGGMTHTFNFNGAGLSTGMYVVRVAGEGFVDTERIMLIK